MDTVKMFVNGQAMSGGTLNHALEDARPLGKVTTAARYRFYAVRDEFPGIYPVLEGGAAVPGELYEVSYTTLRDNLLPNEPEELELALIELEDGTGALSMKMREASIDLPGVIDISDQGGWVSYLSHKQS